MKIKNYTDKINFMGNFNFLEKTNNDIYELCETAEKLFRDEYFDQCITQTRKAAEAMTKNILQSKAESDDTFDDMIYKLKVISKDTMREQEFISDMYFLKKCGNKATHANKSENDCKTALECLEHLFEAAINFAYCQKKDDTLNRLIFDEQLLMTGEKNTSLEEEYKKRLQEEKQREKEAEKRKKEERKKELENKRKNENSQKEDDKDDDFDNFREYDTDKKEMSLFKKITIVFSVIAALMLFIMLTLSENSKSTENILQEKIPDKVQNQPVEKSKNQQVKNSKDDKNSLKYSKILDKINVKQNSKKEKVLSEPKEEILFKDKSKKPVTTSKNNGKTTNSKKQIEKDFSLSGNFSL